MTTTQLKQRLIELERTAGRLKIQVERGQGSQRPWWRQEAGRFRNAPEFEEITRLGAEYRRSLQPEPDLGESERDHP